MLRTEDTDFSTLDVLRTPDLYVTNSWFGTMPDAPPRDASRPPVVRATLEQSDDPGVGDGVGTGVTTRVPPPPPPPPHAATDASRAHANKGARGRTVMQVAFVRESAEEPVRPG